MFAAIAIACITMTVWANNLFQASLERERTFKTLHEHTTQLGGDLAYVFVLTATFIVLLVMFSVYDWLVRRRNRKLIFNAAKANELVTNMFPEQVRERMLNETRTNRNRRRENKRRNEGNDFSEDTVVAELYPNTTLCFSDISGFTGKRYKDFRRRL